MLERYDIAIIGGGILGTSISYWISSLCGARTAVIEKESGVAMHASGRNTGVVHSPFYLNPKTRGMLARSALLSRGMWEDLAKREKIPWARTGVLELALDEGQHKSLERYMKWGDENGIPPDDMRLLDGAQVSKMEPNIRCHSAIHCTREASTDFGALCRATKNESQKNGTDFLMQKNVTDIQKNPDGHTMLLEGGPEISADFVINCAGGNSLDVAHLLGTATQYSDLHFRGEYWVADAQHAGLVGTTAYTVAEFEGYPFLDPHWIKKADGTVEIGPNAVPVLGSEIYEGYVGDIGESLCKLGGLVTGNAKKLLLDPEFLSMVCKEWLSSVSKTAMVGRLKKFIPRVRPEFFSGRGTAGIRSQIITPEGGFLSDVLELKGEGSLSIINYNSPGATGAPAYSAFVVKKLQEGGFLDYGDCSRESIWRHAGVFD